MKKSRFSEEQIAFAPRQVEDEDTGRTGRAFEYTSGRQRASRHG
jgi:hypothetical protein